MSRRLPGALEIVSVIALYALVAAASHTSVWAPARQGDAPLVELVAIVAAVLLIGSAVVGTVTAALHRVRRSEMLLQGKLLQAVPVMIVGVVLVSMLAISRMDLQAYRGPEAEVGSVDRSSGREGVRLEMDWRGPAVRRGGEEEPTEQLEIGRPDGPRLLVWLILVVGIVGLGALATGWWSRRRPVGDPSASAAPDSHRQAARSAIINTIDGMLADPDPGTAIIGAYARLLEDLSVNGAPRREYEGPMEHLHRVLTVLEVRVGPLERLIRLFEEARFSTHSMTPWHRDQALGALHEVAADLAAPSTSAAAGRSP